MILTELRFEGCEVGYAPRNSGPMAYASTKMEMSRDSTVESLTFRSRPIWGRAGADMDDEVGEMKVKTETMAVAPHLVLNAQFLGLSMSWSSFQVT